MDPAVAVPRTRAGSLGRTIARVAVAVPAVALLGYLAVSFAVAERFTHAVRHPVDRAPVVAATTYEDITLRTTDGLTLRGWYFPAPGDRAAVIVHGKDSNRLEGGEKSERMADFLIARGYSVVLFDMRGHGNSEGDRFSLGHLERRDVAAAIEFLLARGFAEERIALIGISMGAGVSLQELLVHPGVGAVVADSAYASARALVEENLERIAGVPSWFTPGVFLWTRIAFGIDGDAVRPIDAVRAQPERAILFIHCTADELIGLHHVNALRAASTNAATDLWLVEPCAHARAYNHHPAEYQARVLAFLEAQIPANR
ncbi:MAG TPA: alpha/beta fold hydrolase [Candidatus Limnocylindria bacterium]|nr:alpha/beta fold hydrolase [Candidatus Limnocylindria bacterium]